LDGNAGIIPWRTSHTCDLWDKRFAIVMAGNLYSLKPSIEVQAAVNVPKNGAIQSGGEVLPQ
jgi:hypothetical protein